MTTRSRSAAAAVWRWPAAALVAAVAAAQEPAGGQAPVPAPARDSTADGGERPAERLQPLLPPPLLLEKVLRGFLENAPGRETLDDVMRRAAVRNRAAEAVEAARRRQFIRQQAQQLEQQLRPLLNVELALVRRACGSLAPEDRGPVLAAARQAVVDVSLEAARRQFEGVGPATEPLDVRRAIHERVAAALEPRAAPDEFAAYARESNLRQERRAEAARTRIVAKIDDQIGLSAAQRRQMLEDLRANWDATWIRELEDHDGMLVNDHPPAPDFADACITPHLDPAQRRQWRQWSDVAGSKAAPRGPAIDWSGLNQLQQGQLKADAWWRP